jgi:hypothetical protein
MSKIYLGFRRSLCAFGYVTINADKEGSLTSEAQAWRARRCELSIRLSFGGCSVLIFTRMMLSRISAIRIVSAGFLALASAAVATAQCYQFSGGGATLQINIKSFQLVNPPFTDPTGQRFASYVFSSDSTLTVGGSTQTSTSFLDGGISIQYLPSFGGSLAATVFHMGAPNDEAYRPGPGGVAGWSADLFGAGDLLPSGIVPVLPPISSWTVPAIAVRNITPVPMVLPWSSVMMGVGLSAVVGLFFGIYPARQAFHDYPRFNSPVRSTPLA